MIRTLALFLAAGALLIGCQRGQDDGPVAVSVIGPAATIVDPSKEPLSTPSAVLLSATAQGLVRFDGAGQIEPGLAIRWAVSDDGLYYTFRLADGLALDAEDAARRLRAAIGRNSRNPLKPLLGTIEEIIAVTPEVIEIRLVAPQPNLLELLAQPELALLANGAGTGPFKIASRINGALLLTPAVEEDEESLSDEERERREVWLLSNRAAMAVARFVDQKSDLVLGGSFNDLAVTRAAQLPPRALRFDPVSGLFGLAVVASKGFLINVDNRRAIAMAIDRDRIAAAFNTPAWRIVTSLTAPGTAEVGVPAEPDWSGAPLPLRRSAAKTIVAAWSAREKRRPHLRIAMPDSPGARLLFTLISIDLASAGVDTERVAMGADADLRLIDAVAPSNSANWYLRHFTCGISPICSELADIALKAAASAPTQEARAARLTDADQRLAEVSPFIPIAQPLRWSLVSPRLGDFQENARGRHPLNHLRPERR
jgi:peptide/nickel transport system substrate-binding protein